jgi:hypothetical protein
LLCVTGLPLIFYHDHALDYAVEPPERPGVDRVASLDAIVAAAAAEVAGSAQAVRHRHAGLGAGRGFDTRVINTLPIPLFAQW